ncbi:sialidase family protein [Massilia alkalitolerans]|uniref:sialidase family protein n=1 Tax=Massilia alkalitolerans TaxID=286638 RepID=UPI0028A9DD13|nr:sialidase family protein [Massilia alkalitolerans]
MRLHIRTRLLVVAALLACVPVRSAPDRDAVSWLPVQEIASGGGAKGPWRQNDSEYNYVDDGTLAFLPGGGLAVAWVDQRRKEVLLQVLGVDGRVRAAPVDVSRSPATFSWMPRIAAGGPDTLHLLWQEIVFSGGSHGGDILYARSLDGGRSFSEPANLSRSRGGDGKGRLDRDTWSNGSLDLAVGADGKVYAAWTDYDGALWLARSRDGGRSFTPPQQIAGDDKRPTRGPALALGSDKAWLAWTVGEDPDADIRVSSSLDDGASFSPPVLVGAGAARADAPRLALDGGGRLHLVYMEQAGKQPATIRHARSNGLDLAFGTPRTLSTRGEAAMAPQLAIDAHGRVHIAWESAQGLRYSRDGGAPVTVPHSGPGGGARQGSQQGLLGKKLAAGDGTVALVNSSLAQGHGSRVWVMRGRLP